MRTGFFVFLLSILSFSAANSVENRGGEQAVSLSDGSRIPDAKLADYVSGSRAPGIMGAPYDVLDLNGKPAR